MQRGGLRQVTTPLKGQTRRALQAARRMADDWTNRPPALSFVPGPGTGTIYYLAPDFDEPSGGIFVIYRHVDLLNRAGRSAAVLHGRTGFRCTWFEHETRICYAKSTDIGSTDLLVVPEVLSALLPTLPPGTRHAIFNQNVHLTWNRARDEVARHYQTNPDLAGVMTVSLHNASLLQYAYPHLDVRRVHLSLDQKLFNLSHSSRSHRISYMPRRARGDDILVIEMLRGHGLLSGWVFERLDGLHLSVVAGKLRESTIFLNFVYHEGFGLPPAEAMACGNYVIGFHGFAGREFLRPEFSRTVETGDVGAMAAAVMETLERERLEPGWCSARGVEASGFVLAEYSAGRERDDVLRFYADIFPNV